ncbi:MAG: hypothetical protein GF308_05645 [Candidatus Heimdallarchaeota archaeon]|nr:hypothetical protein [Candidatus Heimdallarchaeota archaeon]
MEKVKEITFMLTDLDYKIQENDESPTIRLIGKRNGNQILVYIRDFFPYFYITKTKGLISFLENDPVIKRWKKGIEETIARDYFGGHPLNLVKLSVSHPEKIPLIRAHLLKNNFEIHEADIPFLKRFLIDCNIKCLNVISIKPFSVQQKGNQMILGANYKDIKTGLISETTSQEEFYKLKIMAFDIEIDHQGETIQQIMEKKINKIIAISIVWGTVSTSKHRKTFLLREDSQEGEKRIIHSFLKELHRVQPDILVTFNGDNFDLPYLIARMEKLNIPINKLTTFQNDFVYYSDRYRCYRIFGRIPFDLAPRTWGIHPISGKKGLGDIAEEVLGENKIILERTTGEIWHSAFIRGENEEDQKLLRDYSLRDSELTYDLYWKLGTHSWIEVIRSTGYPSYLAPSCTERINGEFELMRYCKQKGVLIPMAPDNQEVKNRKEERRNNPHKGGTVLNPKGSLHIGVIIADFRSMYPSVCVAHNIGGETLRETNKVKEYNPLKMFQKKPKSCLALMQETLIKRREEKKELLAQIKKKVDESKSEKKRRILLKKIETLNKEQYSLKIVANSMYGAHNYVKSRFYSLRLGNAITNIARTYLEQMEQWVAEVSQSITPCEIVYGDTDSAFIKLLNVSYVTKSYNEKNSQKQEQLQKELLELIQQIIRKINSKLPNAMELTLEDFAYKLIFKPGRKKAYSFLSLLTNQLHIKGFEAVRSDFSPIAREAQKKVLELILKEPEKDNHSNNLNSSISGREENPGLKKAKEYLLAKSKEIFEMSVEELIPQVVILSPIKKPPNQYRTKVPAIQAFLDYAKRESLDPNSSWKDFDKFPWVVTRGAGLMSDRARHPKYVTNIDREHYILEILRASENFGLKLSLQIVKNKLLMQPIDEIFLEIAKKNEGKKILQKNPWDVIEATQEKNSQNDHKQLLLLKFIDSKT